LRNCALLGDRAGLTLKVAHRKNAPLALMSIDLDHFKKVTDSQGHDVGDRLLAVLVDRSKVGLREQDTMSRRSGDKFVLMLPDTDSAGAAHVAQGCCSCRRNPITSGPTN